MGESWCGFMLVPSRVELLKLLNKLRENTHATLTSRLNTDLLFEMCLHNMNVKNKITKLWEIKSQLWKLDFHLWDVKSQLWEISN